MINIAFPDCWGKYFLLSVTKKGGSSIQMGAVVDPTSLDINLGDVPGESMTNAAGGKIWKQDSEEDGEVTFDLIGAVEIDSTSAAGGLFQAYVGGTYDTTEPLETDTTWLAGVDQQRDKFMICVLQTNDTSCTLAEGTTAASTDSKRFWVKGARMTSHKESFGDGTNKVSVTFKFPAYTKAGTAKTYAYQSGDTTALVALTYTAGDAI